MELPKIDTSAMSSRFSGLKQKLGFAEATDDDRFDDEYYDEGYEEYADGVYDDGGSIQAYDGGRYGSEYERPAGSDLRSSSSSGPRLVSADDLRSFPLGTSSDSSARESAARTRPASPGLSALFDSTADGSPAPFQGAGFVPLDQRQSQAEVTAGLPKIEGLDSRDPFDAFSDSRVSLQGPQRSLSVVRPAKYADAERIAKILRAGDAAVLSMRGVESELAKRILDFSFGAACYAGASVDCIADKVFVITVGAPLSNEERRELQRKGVL